jgi:hypothetical protein
MQNDYLKTTLANHNQYLESSNHIPLPQYSMPTTTTSSNPTTSITSQPSYHHHHQQQQQYLNGGLSNNSMLTPNNMMNLNGNSLPPHHIQLK